MSTATSPRCPLCDAARRHPSWLGATRYRSVTYEYVECDECGSIYCDPMPDEDALKAMYDTSYVPDDEASDHARVSDWLGRLPRGRFVDYGCGRGRLLELARSLGWEAVGLEFDAAVAAETSKRTGARVVTSMEELGDAPAVDVVHLGDVLEHLTRMNDQLPAILRWVKPGGSFLAQGPLENNASLFVRALQVARALRPRREVATQPPFHVSLATLRGQRELFRRFGIEERSLVVSEVAWPAPETFTPALLRNRRGLALWTLRGASQVLSRLRPHRWGNRYFFAGSVGAASS